MQAVNTSRLWPPFSDPVMQSQQAFRLILKAMSEPGTPVSFYNYSLQGLSTGEAGNGKAFSNSKAPGNGKSRWSVVNIALASYITALTLLDQETKVWLSNTMATPEFVDNLRFHCGCRLMESSLQADFAFMSIDEWSSFEGFKTGCDENPHYSASLIIQAANDFEISEVAGDIDSRFSDQSETLVISGPGVPSKRWVQVPGLSAKHVKLLQNNHQLYPLGRDLIFTFGTSLLALPRSTKVDTFVQRVDPARAAAEIF